MDEPSRYQKLVAEAKKNVTEISPEDAAAKMQNKEAVIVENGVENQIAPFDRQFASKSLGHRFLTIVAGPAMNFVLAFVIFV